MGKLDDAEAILNMDSREYAEKLKALVDSGQILGAACAVTLLARGDDGKPETGNLAFVVGWRNPERYAAGLGRALGKLAAEMNREMESGGMEGAAGQGKWLKGWPESRCWRRLKLGVSREGVAHFETGSRKALRGSF